MSDDLDVRSNRIALLRSVSQLADGLVDMSKMDGSRLLKLRAHFVRQSISVFMLFVSP